MTKAMEKESIKIESGESGLKSTGVAFIVFEHEIVANEFIKRYSHSWVYRGYLRLKAYCGGSNNYYYKKTRILVT